MQLSDWEIKVKYNLQGEEPWLAQAYANNFDLTDDQLGYLLRNDRPHAYGENPEQAFSYCMLKVRELLAVLGEMQIVQEGKENATE